MYVNQSIKYMEGVVVEKVVFKEEEAASYICMSRSFLSQDRVYGTLANRTPGPKFIKIGRSIRYLKDDLDSWLGQLRNKN
jgi:predicted DNA-binding transcriptional regulator AlpA